MPRARPIWSRRLVLARPPPAKLCGPTPWGRGICSSLGSKLAPRPLASRAAGARAGSSGGCARRESVRVVRVSTAPARGRNDGEAVTGVVSAGLVVRTFAGFGSGTGAPTVRAFQSDHDSRYGFAVASAERAGKRQPLRHLSHSDQDVRYGLALAPARRILRLHSVISLDDLRRNRRTVQTRFYEVNLCKTGRSVG